MLEYRLAQMIHDERVRDAEEWRRRRRNAVDAPPFKHRLLQSIGDYLLAVGSKLKELSAVQAGSVTSLRSPNG